MNTMMILIMKNAEMMIMNVSIKLIKKRLEPSRIILISLKIILRQNSKISIITKL